MTKTIAANIRQAVFNHGFLVGIIGVILVRTSHPAMITKRLQFDDGFLGDAFSIVEACNRKEVKT